MGVAARRVHTADELADARRGAFIEPGPAPHGRGGALTAALAITGPSTGPLGDTRVRGRGGPPHKVGEHPHPPAVSTPTRVPGRCSHPRAGVPGDRIWLGRRRAATGWQFRQLGGHVLIRLRACGSNPPGRHHRTQPPSHGRGGFRTAAPANHPAGQDRTRCSPRHRRRQAADVICCQVVHQPTTVTVSALLSSYDAADGTAARCCRCRPPWWRYHCRRWQCARSRRHRRHRRCRWFRRGVATAPPPRSHPHRRRRC